MKIRNKKKKKTNKKLKVLVLNPPTEGYGFTRDGRCQSEENTWLSAFPPAMLAGIAGAVRKKYDTKLIDCIGSKLSFDKCLEQIQEYEPDFTVVNTSTPTFLEDMETARQVKSLTGSKIIVYGEFVTSAYKDVLKKYKFTDFIVRGEAETPVMNIVGGRVKSKGLATQGFDGGIWQEPDMDKLAMPAYDLMPAYYYPLKNKRWMFIRSGRGCPYNCFFCVIPKLAGRKARYHSVEYMIEQVRFINKHGIYYFMLWDEVATYDKKRMLDFCRQMKKTGLAKKNRWVCTTRVNDFDEELAKNMRAAGCFLISLGIESGNQKVLDMNRKGITLEDSVRAVKAAKRYGIKTVGHFIIGLPGSNKDTINQTIDFSKKLGLNFAQFYTATPYWGSRLYEKAKKKKWLYKSKKGYMDQAVSNLSYPKLSSKEIEQLRVKAYKSFYLRPYAVFSLLSSINLKTLIKTPMYIAKFFRWVVK